MKLSRTLLALAALALPLCGGAAPASDSADQDVKKRVDTLFRHLDRDQNDQITRAEVEARAALHWPTADDNSDHHLSEAEIKAMGVARAAKVVADQDSDRNGLLSPKERDGDWTTRLFEETDENSDGVITRTEAERVMNRNPMPQN